MTKIDRYSYWKGTQIRVLQLSYIEEIIELMKIQKMNDLLSNDDVQGNLRDHWIVALQEELRHRSLLAYSTDVVKPLF